MHFGVASLRLLKYWEVFRCYPLLEKLFRTISAFFATRFTALRQRGVQVEYQEMLRKVSDDIYSALEVGTLLRIITDTLDGPFRIRHSDIYLWSDETRGFMNAVTTRHHDTLTSPYCIKPDDPLVISALHASDFILLPLPGKRNAVRVELPTWLETLGIDVVLPLHVADRLVGMLLLSRHRAGGKYSQQELHALGQFGKQAALALDRAQKYEELQRFNQRLEYLVQERTCELEAANVALKAADKAKDEFLAVLSHELLTPLTSILGWSEFALAMKNSTTYERATEITYRNAIRQKHLVNDLLDLSRIIHERLWLRKEQVNLWTVVEACVEAYSLELNKLQLQLEILPPQVDLPVLVDHARMQQVITNLLTNAGNSPRPGGRITIAGRVDDQVAVITVCDTGKGISAEALDKVFLPFEQGERDEATGGLGLGLTLAKGLIEAQGGSIIVESPGEKLGTTFTITLPLALGQA